MNSTLVFAQPMLLWLLVYTTGSSVVVVVALVIDDLHAVWCHASRQYNSHTDRTMHLTTTHHIHIVQHSSSTLLLLLLLIWQYLHVERHGGVLLFEVCCFLGHLFAGLLVDWLLGLVLSEVCCWVATVVRLLALAVCFLTLLVVVFRLLLSI
jgi:hypothetical protein